MRQSRLLVIAALVALVAVACGGGDDAAEPSGGVVTTVDEHVDDQDAHDDGHGEGFAFGEPADPATADRVVAIEMTDQFRFIPDEVTVVAGETITFRLTNAGRIVHDFTLGDAATQDEHDAEMAEMGSMMGFDEHDANAILVGPGETKDLTWHFTTVEGVLFGCHIPGHYAAGMRGALIAGGSVLP